MFVGIKGGILFGNDKPDFSKITHVNVRWSVIATDDLISKTPQYFCPLIGRAADPNNSYNLTGKHSFCRFPPGAMCEGWGVVRFVDFATVKVPMPDPPPSNIDMFVEDFSMQAYLALFPDVPGQLNRININFKVVKNLKDFAVSLKGGSRKVTVKSSEVMFTVLQSLPLHLQHRLPLGTSCTRKAVTAPATPGLITQHSSPCVTHTLPLMDVQRCQPCIKISKQGAPHILGDKDSYGWDYQRDTPLPPFPASLPSCPMVGCPDDYKCEHYPKLVCAPTPHFAALRHMLMNTEKERAECKSKYSSSFQGNDINFEKE